ncbi:MAG: hypothetical protein LC646_10640 [Xanthomonadaceae bacterium]|nr:hypothetical protein [Xanthomonadaceae bacterium]
MTYVAGLYGIQITRPIKVRGLTFEPITNDHQQAEKLARDLDIYHLTATVSGESLDPELCFKMEAVLSFIEHLDVLVSTPIQGIAVGESVAALFPKSLATQRRNNGGGAVVGVDTFFPHSRSKFI